MCPACCSPRLLFAGHRLKSRSWVGTVRQGFMEASCPSCTETAVGKARAPGCKAATAVVPRQGCLCSHCARWQRDGAANPLGRGGTSLAHLTFHNWVSLAEFIALLFVCQRVKGFTRRWFGVLEWGFSSGQVSGIVCLDCFSRGKMVCSWKNHLRFSQ